MFYDLIILRNFVENELAHSLLVSKKYEETDKKIHIETVRQALKKK